MHVLPFLVQANPTLAFVRWQTAHGKSYKSAREAERRRGIFAANVGALRLSCQARRNAYLSAFEMEP